MTRLCRNIACFSWHYSPARNAESLVTQKWVAAMRLRGHRVAVFSWKGRPDAWGKSGTVGDVFRELSSHAAYAFRNDLLDLPFVASLNEYVAASLEEFAALHAADPFDLIVSRYEPVGSAITGSFAQRRSGLPWILCVNDPMPRLVVPRAGLRGLLDRERNRFQRRWAGRLIERADGMVFPSERLKQLTLEAPGRNERGAPVRRCCAVIPHIGGAGAGSYTPGGGARGEAKRVLVRHIGYLSRVRTVETFLAGVELYGKKPDAVPIEVDFVGDCAGQAGAIRAFAEKSLPSLQISISPGVNADEAFALMRASDLLLLVEEPGKTSPFLPSKFCDYAVAGKPILAIAPARGAVADYLRYLGGGMLVPHGEPCGVATALEMVVKGGLKASVHLAAEFSGSRIAESWEAIIEGVLRNNAGPTPVSLTPV